MGSLGCFLSQVQTVANLGFSRGTELLRIAPAGCVGSPFAVGMLPDVTVVA